MPFSFCLAEGSCFHENGDYTRERALVLSLADADERLVEEAAKDLCVFFRQGSAMLTVSQVKSVFIKEQL